MLVDVGAHEDVLGTRPPQPRFCRAVLPRCGADGAVFPSTSVHGSVSRNENLEVLEKKLHVVPASLMTKEQWSPGPPASPCTAALVTLCSLKNG